MLEFNGTLIVSSIPSLGYIVRLKEVGRKRWVKEGWELPDHSDLVTKHCADSQCSVIAGY